MLKQPENKQRTTSFKDDSEMTMNFSDEPQFMEEQKGCSSLAVNVFLFFSGLLCVSATACGFWLFLLSASAKKGLGSIYLLGVVLAFFIAGSSLWALIKVYKYGKD